MHLGNDVGVSLDLLLGVFNLFKSDPKNVFRVQRLLDMSIFGHCCHLTLLLLQCSFDNRIEIFDAVTESKVNLIELFDVSILLLLLMWWAGQIKPTRFERLKRGLVIWIGEELLLLQAIAYDSSSIVESLIKLVI